MIEQPDEFLEDDFLITEILDLEFPDRDPRIIDSEVISWTEAMRKAIQNGRLSFVLPLCAGYLDLSKKVTASSFRSMEVSSNGFLRGSIPGKSYLTWRATQPNPPGNSLVHEVLGSTAAPTPPHGMSVPKTKEETRARPIAPEPAKIKSKAEERVPQLMAAIDAHGWEPLDIPWGGRTKLQADLEEEGMTPDQFTETWDFALRNGLVKIRRTKR